MGQEASTESFDPSIPPRKLAGRNLAAIAEYIKKCEKVVFMVGAGISTAAGIPDFRSPETGLYSNLARLELPRPEAVFDICYFREDPRPFYALAQELWPGKYKPTLTHIFMRMFSTHSKLLRVFTQNIDTLELAAGIPREQIVFAHGSFAGQHCIECKKEYDRVELEDHVRKAEPAFCECGGLVKPDITFFGEALPAEFHESLDLVEEADLVVVMGSSLSVYPFAALPQRVLDDTPRLLINMEKVGEIGSRREDVVWLGECDDGVRELAENLGWWEEMEAIWKESRGDMDLAEPVLNDDTLEDEVNRLTKQVADVLNVADEHNKRVLTKLQQEQKKAEEKKEVAEEKVEAEVEEKRD
ncbi:Similar to NAD-dependent protein deacetylase hst2-1; acc. no. Q5AW69 [Pyronema omphalodes CBS 100304]|uniref:NAD-dependent protein deacetylase n=1 Tax=Pyronema omphalodes (strain CBS 100304) TaxID=1076935 RepID=U4LR52_PYROM|nr:Similar to NAD-dependent protein deacetylase hst2-1; acc. no. Q5AW69 [Pyronema omphalodes CBS 100304]